jgi:hypothetical protein
MLVIHENRRDRMVIWFATTYVVSAYHHQRSVFEYSSGWVYSIQHYVIKFVSDLWPVGGFPRVLRFPPPITTNIVQSGVKHNNCNHNP